MNTMRQVQDDEPLMIAWKAYTISPSYMNSFRHAKTITVTDDGRLTHEHLEGAAWAFFMAGFKAGSELPAVIEARQSDGEV